MKYSLLEAHKDFYPENITIIIALFWLDIIKYFRAVMLFPR